MKNYFIAGEVYDYETDKLIYTFSSIVESYKASLAWNEVLRTYEEDGVYVLIKDIKVVE